MKFLLIVFCLLCQQGTAQKATRLQQVTRNGEYVGDVKLNGTTDFKRLYLQINHHRARYFKKGRQVYEDQGIRFMIAADGLLLARAELNNKRTTYLQCSKFKFSRHTTMAEAEKYFPKSMTENSLHGTDMDKRMIISISESSASKNNYVLYFDLKTNRLYRVEYPE